VHSAHEKKAFDVVVLSLGNSDAFTDYFVLCSARSTRQVRAVVDGVRQQLRSSDNTPSHVEGYDHGEWVLLDFFDFVVHVFTPDTRRFYDLERLWGNATRIPVPEPG
jgi:ribosome-associated protein